MTGHLHRCARPEASHPGDCVCSCGAIVEKLPGMVYQWVWSSADGSTSPFPGPAWKPRAFEVGIGAGRFSR